MPLTRAVESECRNRSPDVAACGEIRGATHEYQYCA